LGSPPEYNGIHASWLAEKIKKQKALLLRAIDSDQSFVFSS